MQRGIRKKKRERERKNWKYIEGIENRKKEHIYHMVQAFGNSQEPQEATNPERLASCS